MTGTSYSIDPSGQVVLLHTPRSWKPNGVGKGIVALHGHGGSALQFMPVPGNAGDSVRYLSDYGPYAVLAGDVGGGTGWSDVAVMAAIDDLYTYLQTGPAKARNGKIGLIGWSMGGLAALNWIKRNPTKVACAWLWAPLTDLDWADANAGWSAEINADYNPYSTASAGFRIHDEPASFRGICPIKIVHATDDATIPQSQTLSFVANVNDPLVTLRTPDVTGGHTQLFSQVPLKEICDFFQANL